MSRQKIPILDAFRFIASVLVVLVHYEIIFGQFLIFGAFATTAVSWFFVVSGFILSYTYPTLEQGRDYRRFYVHRVIRIYPVYFLAVAVSALFVTLNYLQLGEAFFAEVRRPYELTHDLPAERDVDFFVNSTLRHLVFSQSVGSIETLKLLFNGPLWSLVLEMYFYIFFPLFLWLLKPLTTLTRVIAAFVVAYLLQFVLIQINLPAADQYGVMNLNVPVYTNPIVRVIEFIFGMLLYKAFALSHSDTSESPLRAVWARWSLAGVSILLYLLVIISGEKYIPYQYSAFFIAVPFVTIMIYALLGLHWYPSKRWVRFCTLLGGLSYVLYSFHWPLMEMLQFYDVLPDEWRLWLHVPVLLLLLLLVSYLIYRFLETPLRRSLYEQFD